MNQFISYFCMCKHTLSFKVLANVQLPNNVCTKHANLKKKKREREGYNRLNNLTSLKEAIS